MKKQIWLAMVVAALLCFGGVVPGMAEEGVTATEIHIGQWGPQTGPAARCRVPRRRFLGQL